MRPHARERWIGWLRRAGTGLAAIVGFAAVGWLLAYVAGVFHSKVPETMAAATGRAIPAGLERVPVRTLEVPRVETAVGTIRPVHESTLAAKILAHVAEVNVKAGQQVAAGEVLIRLDDQDLQARLRQAVAAEEAAAATLQQATADFQRANDLFQRNAVSRAEYERAEANLKTATADLDRNRQATAAAKIVLDYATVTAPFAGTVVDKAVDVGDTVVPGQILLTLYDPTKMQMVAAVRESLALDLKVGQTLPARLDALGYACQATISEIVPRAEEGSRSFDVKVSGPCPPGIYSGMFGRLLIPRGTETVVLVPQAAVSRIGQLAFVAVVVDAEHWRQRFVTVGREFNGDVEILSGVRPGETVLTPIAAVQERQP